jgi:GTP cyclohydrolase II
MDQTTVQRMTTTRLPTADGRFTLHLYHNNQDSKEHMALVLGELTPGEPVLVRVHSECFTGDVLGSRRCDCGPQLRRAMQLIAAQGAGILIYLRQEGRGIGLLEKLRAYNLQDEGYDTVDANLALGHGADERDYTMAALILQDLGVQQVQLLTNNPAKVEALQALRVAVAQRLPLATAVTPENADYLRTKVTRMRHLLNLADLRPTWPDRNGRPYVTLSYAQSLDGSIAARRGQSTAISGPETLRLTHQLRASHDAILVGIGTVLADDPRLTVRLVHGDDPQRIILDTHLRLPLSAQLLQNGRPPWIATNSNVDPAQIASLQAKGVTVWSLPLDENGLISLPALLGRLKEQGIGSLMVEGGARVITSFLAQQLVDQLVVTVSPRLLGGLNAVENLGQRLNGHGLPRLQNPHYQWLGQDVVLSGEVRWDIET